MDNLARILNLDSSDPPGPNWPRNAWRKVLPDEGIGKNPIRHDCQTLLNARPDDIDRHRNRAELAWPLIIGEDADSYLDREVIATDGKFSDACRDRLALGTRRYFAAGVAAALLPHAQRSGDPSAVARWLCRFADFNDPTPLAAALGRSATDSLDDLADRAVRLVPPGDQFPLRMRFRHTLGDRLSNRFLTPPSHSLSVLFPTFNPSCAGEEGIYALHLARYDDQPKELYEAPEGFPLPMADDLLGVLDQAHVRFRDRFPGAVVWWIRRENGRPPSGSRTVTGLSPTLAVHVGFRSLADGRGVDAGCLMSAKFKNAGDPNPELDKVGGEDRKAEAACRWGRISRFVIADNSPLAGKELTYWSETEKRAVALDRPKTFDDAYEQATGLTAGLKRYLEHAAGLLDAVKPVYFGKRTLSGFYIEPEVFKDDVRLDERAGPGGDRRPEPIPFSVPDELTELLRYYREQLQATRHPWANEWPNLRHAVVVGYPGDGKSVLARELVRDVAKRSLELLMAGETPVCRLELPIFLRLQDVGERKTLEAAMTAQWPADLPPVVADFLKKEIADLPKEGELPDRVWVVLDGLDEVNEAFDTVVSKQLGRLTAARFRVLVTSRPWKYRKGALPFPKLTEYKLAPLSNAQRKKFVTGWFQKSADPGRRATVEALLVGSPSVAEMGRNALLLSLICAVSETRILDPETTRRPQVYATVIEALYCGVWKEEPTVVEDLSTQISVLQHVAWQLFERNPAGWSFHGVRDWVPAVRAARDGMLSMTVADFRTGLRKTGLIVDTGNGYEAFLHRSFLEYLAAAYVATLPVRNSHG